MLEIICSVLYNRSVVKKCVPMYSMEKIAGGSFALRKMYPVYFKV